jgi:hypothetical protein
VDPLESLPILMDRGRMYSSLEGIFKDFGSLVKVPPNQIIFKNEPTENLSLEFPLSKTNFFHD